MNILPIVLTPLSIAALLAVMAWMERGLEQQTALLTLSAGVLASPAITGTQAAAELTALPTRVVAR